MLSTLLNIKIYMSYLIGAPIRHIAPKRHIKRAGGLKASFRALRSA